jgi:hypothetical protein
LKITTSQNVLVQTCIGAVSCHFQDLKWRFLNGRHGSVMRTFTGK